MPQQTGSFRSHHGEEAADARPTISEDKKAIYKKHFDEAWYEAMCTKWKMNEYVWDIEQFRFNEKEVSGNYPYITEIDQGDTEKISGLYNACLMFLKSCQIPRHVEGRTLLNI